MAEEISAKVVMALREKTNAGMMDCKKALAEAGGDIEKAETLLRKKGITKAGSKGDRQTKASSPPTSTWRAASACSSR